MLLTDISDEITFKLFKKKISTTDFGRRRKTSYRNGCASRDLVGFAN